MITRDGTIPSELRTLARKQTSVYTSVSMMIVPSPRLYPRVTIATSRRQIQGRQYLSKKIILATGMKDLLPDTPGLATRWGKGITVRSIHHNEFARLPFTLRKYRVPMV